MTRYSQLYDSSYLPSAPVVDVLVEGYGSATPGVRVAALVDSGADGTIFPLTLLEQLAAPYWGTRQIFGFTGGSQRIDQYSVTLQIGQAVIYGIRAVGGGTGTDPLLGRDVLNQLRVILDGPAETLKIDI